MQESDPVSIFFSFGYAQQKIGKTLLSLGMGYCRLHESFERPVLECIYHKIHASTYQEVVECRTKN